MASREMDSSADPLPVIVVLLVLGHFLLVGATEWVRAVDKAWNTQNPFSGEILPAKIEAFPRTGIDSSQGQFFSGASELLTLGVRNLAR